MLENDEEPEDNDEDLPEDQNSQGDDSDEDNTDENDDIADDGDDDIIDGEEPDEEEEEERDESTTRLSGLYETWFLDYASYVILERAVPALEDGLKPVQRRIMHSLKELDDGRYNKVANVIGNTMKYHPHGDASIGDAMVAIGQKDLLIDTQGNWGNTLTGDGAAAPRYIEARLTKFALEVVFNPKTTVWQTSYDGRNKEPVHLPVKFPLLLAQGAEGIAVGLACKMLPHNFVELLDGAVEHLRGRKPKILPDFPNGGSADFSNYNDGLRGGKVRVRAKIVKLDKKTLVINEIPFGTTTTSLMESIVKANDKSKIKIKKIEDNTSDVAEILVHLPPGVSPDKMIDALFAFTDCEVSISPNACVIYEDKPQFKGVTEMLRDSVDRTVVLLRKELEIKKAELEEKWHFSSLEKIFIEERIYRDIEEAETWEAVIGNIRKGLKPFIKHLKRKVTEEDIVRLTEIRIKRISKFDAFKADELIKGLEDQLEEVQNHLDNLIDYAIDYFKNLKEKYGEGRERKTEIKTFDTISAKQVIVSNRKLYVNREEGFIGWSLKKDEFISDCSEIDDVILFFEDGTMQVTKMADKKFVGKNIVHCAIWKKNDTRTVYHLIYQDGKTGPSYMKRFIVKSITRDKSYHITKGTKGSKVHYFTVNPNGEREVVTVQLRPRPHLKKVRFDIDFGELAIKGRGATGNRATKEIVSKITQKEVGGSTLSARKIWFDDVVERLNDQGRGRLLGAFRGDDRIISIYEGGYYKLTKFNLDQRFDDGLKIIQKWDPKHSIAAIYWDANKEKYYIKRFTAEPPFDKANSFIGEDEGTNLVTVQANANPRVKIVYSKRYKETKHLPDKEIAINDFIEVKGMKAQGNQLTKLAVKDVLELPPLEGEDPDVEALVLAEEKARKAALQAKEDAEAEAAAEAQNEKDEASKEGAVTVEWDSEGEEVVKKPKPIKDSDDDKNQATLF